MPIHLYYDSWIKDHRSRIPGKKKIMFTSEMTKHMYFLLVSVIPSLDKIFQDCRNHFFVSVVGNS